MHVVEDVWARARGRWAGLRPRFGEVFLSRWISPVSVESQVPAPVAASARGELGPERRAMQLASLP